MRRKLQALPLWVTALLAWPFVTVCVLAASLLVNPFIGVQKSFADLAIDAAIRGLSIGPVTVIILARYHRRAREVTGIEDRDELRVVQRATQKGPVPSDPRLRAAARNLALDLREKQLMLRPFAVCFEILLGLAFTAAVVWSFWFAVVATLFFLIAALTWTAPRRIERRIELLSDAENTSADTKGAR
ncbi:hypothetical protein [Kineosporia babensis]|uniref:Uncharacterized protein n=1 Tax=Kineosporia babensis TaxID=499548 RepID=A0A9X1NL36_9ACTN|nr:hypothetical protein [Kineosporia babensis]MCD5315078.1 hypothetical protein [Kineosporia babensis]